IFIGRQESRCKCNFFKWMMDEVRIWNIARSQFLISYFKNAPLPSPRGIPPNLVASFHLDEAAGALTFDLTNGYSAGLSNGPVWVNSTAPIVGLADAEARLASDITGNSAVLTGYVDPHLEPTAVWFEYGTSSSDYSNTTGPTNVPAVNYIVPVNIPISGLALSTTYYYRVAALNHYGTTRS